MYISIETIVYAWQFSSNWKHFFFKFWNDPVLTQKQTRNIAKPVYCYRMKKFEWWHFEIRTHFNFRVPTAFFSVLNHEINKINYHGSHKPHHLQNQNQNLEAYTSTDMQKHVENSWHGIISSKLHKKNYKEFEWKSNQVIFSETPWRHNMARC